MDASWWNGDDPRGDEFDDLDPDVFCLKHGKPLATKCASYCEDCEPPEPDGEDFRGGEAAGYGAEQQAAAQRLK